MESKKTAVYGIYSNLTNADSAVDHLLTAGFSNSDVSVLAADSESTREFAHRKATKAPEGTATGATAGGVFWEERLVCLSELECSRSPDWGR